MKDGSVGKVGRGTGVGNCQMTQSLSGSMVHSLNDSIANSLNARPGRTVSSGRRGGHSAD